MPEKKLTPDEITKVVEKIRRRYEEYIYKFFKPRSLRSAFEDRYIFSIRSGVDVSTFLMAEISAIEELIKREEDRVAYGTPRPGPEKKGSFSEKVDQVIEEHQRKIQKYADINFHNDASDEIRHLLGALSDLEQKYWERLVLILRETAYSRNSMTMVNLESRLRFLGGLGEDGVSPSLARYLYHLKRFPRNYNAVDREEKEYILESAFFLHDLNEILERVSLNYPQLKEDSQGDLKEIQGYVLGIIRDFRVKDLKRKK